MQMIQHNDKVRHGRPVANGFVGLVGGSEPKIEEVNQGGGGVLCVSSYSSMSSLPSLAAVAALLSPSPVADSDLAAGRGSYLSAQASR